MLQTEQYEQAVWYFSQVLRAVPKDGILSENDKRRLREVHYHMGLALSAQGKFDEAIRHYSQVLETKPDDWQTHYNLGLALQSQGRLDEALLHYRRALQAKPDFLPAQNMAALLIFAHPDANARDAKQEKP
jgi:Flp pilus assembly protein TadD